MSQLWTGTLIPIISIVVTVILGVVAVVVSVHLWKRSNSTEAKAARDRFVFAADGPMMEVIKIPAAITSEGAAVRLNKMSDELLEVAKSTGTFDSSRRLREWIVGQGAEIIRTAYVPSGEPALEWFVWRVKTMVALSQWAKTGKVRDPIAHLRGSRLRRGWRRLIRRPIPGEANLTSQDPKTRAAAQLEALLVPMGDRVRRFGRHGVLNMVSNREDLERVSPEPWANRQFDYLADNTFVERFGQHHIRVLAVLELVITILAPLMPKTRLNRLLEEIARSSSDSDGNDASLPNAQTDVIRNLRENEKSSSSPQFLADTVTEADAEKAAPEVMRLALAIREVTSADALAVVVKIADQRSEGSVAAALALMLLKDGQSSSADGETSAE